MNLDTLFAGLPQDAGTTDSAELALHARDAAPFGEAGRPVALVRPETAAQVQHVMRFASEHRVPVVPQGARTGLAGGANAVDGCILLSLAGMNRILEIDPASRLARCEPGVITADLARAVAEHGMSYPPDPASWETCTIGGNISTGAGGICCVKYGVTADYVLGLTLVLADGTLTRIGRRTVKGVAGFDLVRLVTGSEGTLAVIVEATLALRPAMPPALALLAQFGSPAAAGEAVAAIVRSGHTPSAMELLDRVTTEAITALGHPLLAAGAGATLIVSTEDGDLPELAKHCETAGASSVRVAADAGETRQILDARRLVLPALQAQAARTPGRPAAYIEDVAVPRAQLAAFIEQIGDLADSHDVYVATIGHAGDGNLHPAVVFDAADPAAVARAEQCYDAIMAAGLALGGTITGEHGVGTLKRGWLARELDPPALALHRGIKQLFDPSGILNPGKVIE
ncbi:FAD-linked oxidase C-terminal domain-containing protein [Longispora albida]|uniref:FAD-linked oxidase C-terminal domain-containing protein n=1 Tax=Longispora albida TaxID=203523 RepID=UPI00037DA45E